MMRGPAIPPFYAGEIGRRGAARVRAGLPFLPMNFGQPTAGAPRAAIEAAHRVLDRDALGYWDSMALRESLSRNYHDVYGVDVSPDRILLTAGASAGLVAAFTAYFRAGDRIAVVRPGYPAYRNTLSALGLVPVELPCRPEHHYRPSPEMLATIDPAPAGFILAGPANPTGTMVERGEMAAFVEVCRERGIQLISDEIYHGITFRGRAVSALELDPGAVVINSFSKYYRMPGWRLGWMVVPSDDARAIGAYLINMFLTPSTLAQHAAQAAMSEHADLEHWVRTYARNGTRLIEGLSAMGIPGLTLPDGAFYVYANFGSVTQDSLQLCIRAVEEIGVGLAPGIDFDPQDGHRFVRFSFAITPEEVERAIELLGNWLPGYRR